LNYAHHALYERKDVGSIASIARDSGFWHMGQFYKDYKKFFGELPSDTFKKNFLKLNLG
jgi:AraC family ethanolamine operon transcriptional activator